jgi:hypothetical protein
MNIIYSDESSPSELDSTLFLYHILFKFCFLPSNHSSKAIKPLSAKTGRRVSTKRTSSTETWRIEKNSSL